MSGHVPYSLFPYNITTNLRLSLYFLVAFFSFLFVQTAFIVYKNTVYSKHLYADYLASTKDSYSRVVKSDPMVQKDFDLLYYQAKSLHEDSMASTRESNSIVINPDSIGQSDFNSGKKVNSGVDKDLVDNFYSFFNISPENDYDVEIVQSMINKYKLGANLEFNQLLIASDIEYLNVLYRISMPSRF